MEVARETTTSGIIGSTFGSSINSSLSGTTAVGSDVSSVAPPTSTASEAGQGAAAVAELSTLLFCRMCQAVYRQPKLLPCLHSFCRTCLEAAVQRSPEANQVTCPVCSHVARLSPSGVGGLTDNLLLTRLCGEYVSEVKTHLGARSLSSARQTAESSTTSGTESSTTAGTESSTTSEGESSTTLRTESSTTPSSESVAAETSSIMTDVSSSTINGDVINPEFNPLSPRSSRRSEGDDATSAVSAIRNMSRLQAKIMNLQGEALRVTYAIDRVNQATQEWHRNNQDLKRAVERRSEQFQFYIKRMERQLMAQIDSRSADDTLYAQSDRSKTQLRQVLRNILHELNVLKSVQELGKDAEINTMCPALLAPSVGMKDVHLTTSSYKLDLPVSSIEEATKTGFGDLALCHNDVVIFAPENSDFTDISLDKLVVAANGANGEGAAVLSESSSFHEHEHVVLTGQAKAAQEPTDVQLRRGSECLQNGETVRTRRRPDRNSRRHRTDLGLETAEVKEFLLQSQTTRESLRDRRREILRQGQLAREDASPMRPDVFLRQRSKSRGRGSLPERGAQPQLRQSLRSSFEARSELDSTNQDETETGGVSSPPSDPPSQFQFGVGSSHYVHRKLSEEVNVPSPVMEEASYPHSPQGQKTSPLAQENPPLATETKSGSPSSVVSGSSSLMARFESSRNRLPSTDFTSHRRHSSTRSPPLSPEEPPRNRGQVARRSISSAADKRQKIEFLRETWQKRKEILIQNEGFMSNEVVTPRSASKATDASQQSVSELTSIDVEKSDKELPKTTATDSKPRITFDSSVSTNSVLERKAAEDGVSDEEMETITEVYNIPLLTEVKVSDPAVKESHLDPTDETHKEGITKSLTQAASFPSSSETRVVTTKSQAESIEAGSQRPHTIFTPISSQYTSEHTSSADSLASRYPTFHSGLATSKYSGSSTSNSTTGNTMSSTSTTLQYTGRSDLSRLTSGHQTTTTAVTSTSMSTTRSAAGERRFSDTLAERLGHMMPASSSFSSLSSAPEETDIRRDISDPGLSTTMADPHQTYTRGGSGSALTSRLSGTGAKVVSPTRHVEFSQPVAKVTAPLASVEVLQEESRKPPRLQLGSRHASFPESPDDDFMGGQMSPTSPITSPVTSPNAPDQSKIRDIARKKKERWRHLTIH